VVDWYYQQQADFFNQMRTLEAETKFLLQYPLAESAAGMLSSGGASLQSHSTVVKVMVRFINKCLGNVGTLCVQYDNVDSNVYSFIVCRFNSVENE
jgi:hypothetical protein